MTVVAELDDVHVAWAGLLEAEALPARRPHLAARRPAARRHRPAGAAVEPVGGVGPPGPGAADAVADALRDGATAVLVPVTVAEPWAPVLEAAGLGPPEERDTMIRATEVDETTGAGLTVEAATPATLADHVRVQAEAYGDDPDLLSRWLAPMLGAPHIRLLTGRADGEPVASAMALVHAPTGVAGIFGVGTVPAARGAASGPRSPWPPWRRPRAWRAPRVPRAHARGGGIYDRLGFTRIPGRLLWKQR